MRSETSEALGRLVSIFVTAIEGAGEVIPDSAIEQLATDPLGTCEKLNELALSCGAIDEAVDAALATVYESMDAADARSAADEACVASVVSAWTSTHVERPVEEPASDEVEAAPEERSAAEADPGEPAQDEEGEPAEKPKRRRNRRRRDAEEPQPEPEGECETQPEEQPTEKADVKPGRRSRAKAKEQAEKGEGAEKPKRGRKRTEKVVEERAEADEAPATEAQPTESAEAEAAKPEPAANAAAAPEAVAAPTPTATESDAQETLNVDQATAILGVSRPTIYKLIESGELPAHKKGRSWRISAAAVADRASSK